MALHKRMRPYRLLNHQGFTLVCIAVMAAAAVIALLMASRGQWLAAGAMAIVAGLAVGCVIARKTLPRALGALLSIAAMVNAAGYVFSLWQEDTSFDELVHAFTSFVGMTAIGWTVVDRSWFDHWPKAGLFAGLMGAALLLGVLWEAFEWIIGLIGDRRDTVIDLVMDLLGATAAGALTLWIADWRRRRRDGPRLA